VTYINFAVSEDMLCMVESNDDQLQDFDDSDHELEVGAS